MQLKRTELSRLYLATLQQHLKASPAASLEPAHALGRRAMELGLETLDLARIHEIALVTLVLPGYSSSTRDGLMGLASMFFAEVITPLEETHRGAREANIHLNYMITALSQRTHELADSVDELKQEIAQRTAVEESLRISQQTSSKLLKKSLQMQEELRHLSRQLLSVQEEERKRISRELHDVIAQTLTGINVRLAALKTESTVSSKELQKKIASTQRLVEKSVDIVHRFARELRPSVLDDLGLIPALESFMKGFMKDTGVRASLTAFAGVELVDNTARTVLYRIAQEALTNVARHAKASQVAVSIQDQDGGICMEITDNGQGFEVDGTSKPKKQSNRLGLLGMRERVEMIGGTFCIESAPGKGTTVRVEIAAATDGAKKTSAKKTNPSDSLECP
ncbi:MAG: sensor histidine kinase [Prosthecobacter sp.]|uniref:sensor histidine kinase n=1 Tax=Prosthecobacter sp. TaxID=1965333 RepID=UPI0038FD7288